MEACHSPHRMLEDRAKPRTPQTSSVGGDATRFLPAVNIMYESGEPRKSPIQSPEFGLPLQRHSEPVDEVGGA